MVESTGEVISFDADTPAQVIDSMRLLKEYVEAYDQLKRELQARAQVMEANGEQLEHNGYGVRIFSAFRKNYDKAVLRQVLDEDTFDLMMEPAKSRIDRYIAENLEQLGEDSTRLRQSMVMAGKPYTTVRLERLTAEAA
jgi:hypothetical protein